MKLKLSLLFGEPEEVPSYGFVTKSGVILRAIERTETYQRDEDWHRIDESDTIELEPEDYLDEDELAIPFEL